MSTTLFNNYDFASKNLFYISFDYNKCMTQPFYKELYSLFRKQKDGRKNWHHSFKEYLEEAHKTCAILTMHLDLYCELHYPDMVDSTLRYLSSANYIPDNEEDWESIFLNPDEICLVMMLSYTLLSVKNNPILPFDLVECYENQITQRNCIAQNLDFIYSLRNPEYGHLRQDKLDLHVANWELVSEMFLFDLRKIIDAYTQNVNIDINFTPLKWGVGNWYDEDLADWICYEDELLSDIIGSPQYDAEKAKHFVSFWKQKDRKLTVVNAIEEWSKQNLQAFGALQLWKIQVRHTGEYREYLKSNSLNPVQLEADRAQAIKELYEYVEEVHKKEVEETAVAEQAAAQAQGANLVRLNLSKGKAANNNIINTVRVFNVLHELGFFANANGTPITKTDLFNALSNIFACPELTDWSNKLSSSRGQAAGSRKAQLKIFNTMLETQETILDDLDDKAEQRYR